MPTPHREDKLIGGQMMNYEVNPFQDYESITVDELKDQANSLLNLVTEEQRPLRVCMNKSDEQNSWKEQPANRQMGIERD